MIQVVVHVHIFHIYLILNTIFCEKNWVSSSLDHARQETRRYFLVYVYIKFIKHINTQKKHEFNL